MPLLRNLIAKFIYHYRFKFILVGLLSVFLTLSPITLSGVLPDKDQELRNKIAQMLLIGFRGTEINEESHIYKVLKDINIGGVVLFDYDVPSQSFPRNITSPKQTKKLISDLQAYSKVPLFVAVDAEGGRINRLKEKYGFIPIPSAKEICTQELEKADLIYTKLATQLADLGFNLNLAPVVDVDVNPDNPIIGALGRSFSKDHRTVTDYALTFINAHEQAGIITALKHFPGHGSASTDSHLGMVDITESYRSYELDPYRELIKRGKAEMIMTAHIMNTRIDPDYPATLSENFLQKILREELKFKGIIISDDMQMGAIRENYGFEEALIQAINAGCNILAISNNGETYDENIAYKALEIIFTAVKSGKIGEDKINDSYTKIINLKKKFKIIETK